MQFACQLHTLYLTARKRTCRLSESEIAKSHIYHTLQCRAYLLDVKKVHRLFDGQAHDLLDVHSLVGIGKCSRVIAMTAALFAWHNNRLGKCHIVGDLSRAFADSTASL